MRAAVLTLAFFCALISGWTASLAQVQDLRGMTAMHETGGRSAHTMHGAASQDHCEADKKDCDHRPQTVHPLLCAACFAVVLDRDDPARDEPATSPIRPQPQKPMQAIALEPQFPPPKASVSISRTRRYPPSIVNFRNERESKMSLRTIIAATMLVTLSLTTPVIAQETDHSKMNHGSTEGMGQPKGDTGASSKAFAEANAKMHDAMDITFTGNADADFVRGMIAHHQGAIDMAKIELEYGKDAELRKLAEGIISAQEAEIKMMKEWLARNGG